MSVSMVCCGGFQRRKEWTAEDVEAMPVERQLNHRKVLPPEALPTRGDGPTNVQGEIALHPYDSSINMSVHQHLYPPGRIVHLVRKYKKQSSTSGRWGTSRS